jgi:hypothetical protein
MLTLAEMTTEPISDSSACPECGSPDVTDGLNAKTGQTVVTYDIALVTHPVHVVASNANTDTVWSRSKPRDSRSD